MAGSIKPVPGKKGVWEIRYDSFDENGKRKQHKKRFTGTKGQADKQLVEIQNRIHRGEYTDSGNVTLRDYLKNWADEYCKSNLAYKTYQSYTGIIDNYINMNLGNSKLKNLKPAQIQSYYTLMTTSKDEGGKGLSSTSVLYHHRVLHEALRHAVNLGHIIYNPTDRVKPPRKNKPEMKVLNKEQAQYLINKYKGTRVYLPILLALMTGMRQGEICGLCWKDVNLEKGIISVTHSLQRQGKELVLKEPKTKKSRRSIPLSADVIKQLKRVQLQQKQDKLATGKGYDKRGFVCAWEDSRPMEPDWVSKQWRKIIKNDSKLPDGVRFHDLRHTHATILLSQGLNLKMVQERLGHESIATTGDIYSHVTPAMAQEAVKILDSMFSSEKKDIPI